MPAWSVINIKTSLHFLELKMISLVLSVNLKRSIHMEVSYPTEDWIQKRVHL